MVNVPRAHSAASMVPQHADTATGASTLPSVPASTERIMSKTSAESDVSVKCATGAKTAEVGRITTCDSQVFKESAKRLRMYADAKSPRKKRLTTRAMNEFTTDTNPGPSLGKQRDSTRPLHHYTSSQTPVSNDTNWLKGMPTHSLEGTPSFAPQGIRRSFEQQAQNISAFNTLQNPRPSALPDKTPLAGTTTRTSIVDNRPKLFPPPSAGSHTGAGFSSNYLNPVPNGEARGHTDASEPSQAKLDTLVERMIAYARSKESGVQSGTSRDAEQTHSAASSLPHRQLLSTEDPIDPTISRPDVTRTRLGFEIPVTHRRASAPSGTGPPSVSQRVDVPHSLANPPTSSKPFLGQNTQQRVHRDDTSRMTSSFSSRGHQPDLRKLAPSPEMVDIAGNGAPSSSEFRIHRDLLGLNHNNGISRLSSDIRTPLHDPSNNEPIRSNLHRIINSERSSAEGNTPSSSEQNVPSITVKPPDVNKPDSAKPQTQASQPLQSPHPQPSRPQSPRNQFIHPQSSRTQPLKASQSTHQPITATPPEQSGRKSSSEKEEEIRPTSNHTQRWTEMQWRAFSRSMLDSLIETGILPAQATRLFTSMIRNLPEEMRGLSLFEVSRRLTVWQENAEKFRKR